MMELQSKIGQGESLSNQEIAEYRELYETQISQSLKSLVCDTCGEGERIYLYPLHKPTNAYCAKHLKALDPDYKYQLDQADEEARRFGEKKAYDQVKALSHQQAHRPTFLKRGV